MSILKVNIKHDAGSYEKSSYKREITDGNALYDAYLQAKRGSDWKPHAQRFEMNHLVELAKIQRGLESETLTFRQPSTFVVNERGKSRAITGEQIHDRIVKRCLCDEALLPAIHDRLIYDNGASLKGRGITFSRNRLDTHLRRFYKEHGNQGYILLVDYVKYFDNIRHKEFVGLFDLPETESWLLSQTVKQSRVDVSYMDDETFKGAMDSVFNSLDHQKIDRSRLTGEKYLDKHLNIGDQVSQVAGIAYPTPIDNYIKIVRGVRYYARYMDDSYVVHHDREYLEELWQDIVEQAKKIGITIHPHKTRICKLSDKWRFLQIQYSLTETGRIIKKIHPKRMTTMRRKLKKLAPLLPEKEFQNLYQSWFLNHYKMMSRLQRENIEKLYKELTKEAPTWHSHLKVIGLAKEWII